MMLSKSTDCQNDKPVGFIAAAMAEHGKPSTPPIVPRIAKAASDGAERKAEIPEQQLISSSADEDASIPNGDDKPAYLIAGRDNGDKPHAAWFNASDHLKARDATRGTDYLLINLVTPELHAIASELVEGVIHDSGKARVPFVKGDLYKRLEAAAPLLLQKDRSWKLPRNITAEMMNKIRGAKAASNRGKLEEFSVVLSYSADEEAWYESVIVDVDDDGVCSLVYADYVDEPIFSCHRDMLALMPPALPYDNDA